MFVFVNTSIITEKERENRYVYIAKSEYGTVLKEYQAGFFVKIK